MKTEFTSGSRLAEVYIPVPAPGGSWRPWILKCLPRWSPETVLYDTDHFLSFIEWLLWFDDFSFLFQLDGLTCWAISMILLFSRNRVWLFVTPWTAVRQASLSITIFRSLLRLMSTESVMPSNHRILCRPLLLPPSVFLRIGTFPMKSHLFLGIM